MAIYHLSVKIISRGKGASAIAKAAYHAAESITSEYDGKTSDYTRKKGVVYKEILLPENAPKEYENRAVLWNAVEKSERYKTAQLARDVEVALPRELTREQQIKLVKDYVKKQFVDNGMCADICVHDTNNGNPHCHIMLTMRPIEKDGKWGAKSRTENGEKVPTVDWNNRANVEIWREQWAEEVNSYLSNIGVEKIDHRSFKRQGKDEMPTVHLGVAAHQMEQKGIPTDRGNQNRKARSFNDELKQIKARIVKLDNWLKSETKATEQPTLAAVIEDILSRRAQSGKAQHYQTINNLKTASKLINFLTTNHIRDMADLESKVKEMYHKQADLREKSKPIERRLKTLDEHIEQAEKFKKFKGKKQKYEELYSEYETARKAKGLFAKRNEERALKAANEYYADYRFEIVQFENAEKYLKAVLQDRFDPKKAMPIKMWQEERERLTDEREVLRRELHSLKDEVKETEQIRRSVYEIMREEMPRNEQTKRRDMEL